MSLDRRLLPICRWEPPEVCRQHPVFIQPDSRVIDAMKSFNPVFPISIGHRAWKELPGVSRWLASWTASEETVAARILEAIHAIAEREAVHFLIERRADQAAIGYVRVARVPGSPTFGRPLTPSRAHSP